MPKIVDLDWSKVRADYVGDPKATYASLAKKYGVTAKAVGDHGTREKWLEARKNVVKDAIQKSDDLAATELAKVNNTHRLLYSNWQALQSKIMNELHQEVDALILDARMKGTYVRSRQMPSSQGMMFFANGLKTSVDGERVTLGLPTTVTKSESEVKVVEEFTKLPREVLHAMLNEPED